MKTKLAQAIKDKLIQLAINDELPHDLNELDINVFNEIETEIERQDFMDFFRADDFHEKLTPDDTAEIFQSVLHGNSDITIDSLNELLSNYEVSNIEIAEIKPPKKTNELESLTQKVSWAENELDYQCNGEDKNYAENINDFFIVKDLILESPRIHEDLIKLKKINAELLEAIGLVIMDFEHEGIEINPDTISACKNAFNKAENL